MIPVLLVIFLVVIIVVSFRPETYSETFIRLHLRKLEDDEMRIRCKYQDEADKSARDYADRLMVIQREFQDRQDKAAMERDITGYLDQPTSQT